MKNREKKHKCIATKALSFSHFSEIVCISLLGFSSIHPYFFFLSSKCLDMTFILVASSLVLDSIQFNHIRLSIPCSINGLLNECVIIMSISLSLYRCTHVYNGPSNEPQFEPNSKKRRRKTICIEKKKKRCRRNPSTDCVVHTTESNVVM